jgi:6-phosphogluconolactonase
MTKTKFKGYIGTYTKGDSEGIYSFTLNTESKQIEDVKVAIAAKIENPTYVTVSNDNQYLYAVAKEENNGGVVAYSIQDNGELQIINQQFSEGSSPCHVSTNKSNQTLLASYYHRGTVEAYQLNNGSIDSNPFTVQHEGEAAPHTHYAAFTPDEKYVTAVDLGLDQLITYQLVDNELQKVSELNVSKGSGPRHLAFHPNGKIAYLMTEHSSEIYVLQYDASNGSFTVLQSLSTLPADYKEHNQGAAIHISSDGRFVYASNRGHNSIAVLRVDQETYQLELITTISTEGDWPRDFILDPTEAFMVASNQESSNVVLYSRNAETGELTLLQSDIAVPYPVCVKFLNA